jgi:hypothetical protein
MYFADEDSGAGDAEGHGVAGDAILMGIDGGVDAFGLEEGNESEPDLVGERAGEREFAVVGGDFGFYEGFELGGLPPDEVGEMDGLELVAGRGNELDDEGGGVDGVADVGEEAGIAEALEGGFDLLLGEGSVGGESGDAESFSSVDGGGRVDADGFGGVGLRERG